MIKKLFVISILSLTINANAQPVVSNGSNLVIVGTTGTWYLGTAAAGAGTAGANQTWNFSGTDAMQIAGSYHYLAPSTTPYASTFTTATLCEYNDSTSGFLGSGIFAGYNYFQANSNILTQLAYGYFGSNYNHNHDSCNATKAGYPIPMLKFPFNFNDSVPSMEQSYCSASSSSYPIKYDAYGTLTTPFGNTYSNVIRVKAYSPGGLQYYFWATNPVLMPVFAIISAANVSFEYGIPSTTNISQITDFSPTISLYPNPSSGSFFVEPNSTTKQTMQVYDVNGKPVLSQSINGKTTIDASNLNEGVYNISITSYGGIINKRLVIIR